MSSWVHRKMSGAVNGGLRLLWGGYNNGGNQDNKDNTQWYHNCEFASPG